MLRKFQFNIGGWQIEIWCLFKECIIPRNILFKFLGQNVFLYIGARQKTFMSDILHKK